MNTVQQEQSFLERYTLEYAGHRIEVEATGIEDSNIARLFVDGELVDEQRASRLARSYLQWEELKVIVQWGLSNAQVVKCVLVEATPVRHETPFLPPPGTHAARLAQFQRDHPVLYAMRHIAVAILQVTLPLLGLGLLLTALLPEIDLPWADIRSILRGVREQIGLWIPDINLGLPDPRELIRSIVRSPEFVAIRLIWGRIKWLVPVIVAIVVAIREIKRHKEKAKGKPAQ